jgi:hypothetical protein
VTKNQSTASTKNFNSDSRLSKALNISALDVEAANSGKPE